MYICCDFFFYFRHTHDFKSYFDGLFKGRTFYLGLYYNFFYYICKKAYISSENGKQQTHKGNQSNTDFIKFSFCL